MIVISCNGAPQNSELGIVNNHTSQKRFATGGSRQTQTRSVRSRFTKISGIAGHRSVAPRAMARWRTAEPGCCQGQQSAHTTQCTQLSRGSGCAVSPTRRRVCGATVVVRPSCSCHRFLVGRPKRKAMQKQNEALYDIKSGARRTPAFARGGIPARPTRVYSHAAPPPLSPPNPTTSTHPRFRH